MAPDGEDPSLVDSRRISGTSNSSIISYTLFYLYCTYFIW